MRSLNDTRAVIAFFVLLWIAFYSFALLLTTHATGQMPDWMKNLAFTVSAYFFGFREGTTRAESLAQLVAELERRSTLPDGANGRDLT